MVRATRRLALEMIEDMAEGRPNRWRRAASLMATLALFAVGSAVASMACPKPGAIGLKRIVEIDASTGPLYGNHTRYPRQADFLQPMEVVLTFDDGPMPWITRSILDTLDAHCTRATFFSVGRMAVAYPEMVREVIARGHTMGTHTWSHPLDLRRRALDVSTAEIERGFAAVAAAAGVPIAPFFRFPGLSDSAEMLAHLQARKVATFTVDVVSNDSYISNGDRLLRETLAKIEARKGGIVLFHDIKAVAAKVLPTLLDELKSRGYRVVHMTAKATHVAEAALLDDYKAQVAKTEAQKRSGKQLLPFYGAAGPQHIAAVTAGVPVQPIAAEMKVYADAAKVVKVADAHPPSKWRTRVKRRRAADTDD